MTQSDSQTGTPVTLVVRPAQPAPAAPPGHHPLPFTGLELLPLLLLALLVMALGSALLVATRRRPARPVRSRPCTAPSRRTS